MKSMKDVFDANFCIACHNSTFLVSACCRKPFCSLVCILKSGHFPEDQTKATCEGVAKKQDYNNVLPTKNEPKREITNTAKERLVKLLKQHSDSNANFEKKNVNRLADPWFLNPDQTKRTLTYKVIESKLPDVVKTGAHNRSVQDRLKLALQKADAVKETAKKSSSGKMVFDVASGKLRQMDRIDQALANGNDLHSLNVQLLSEEEKKKLAMIFYQLDRQKEMESYEAHCQKN